MRASPWVVAVLTTVGVNSARAQAAQCATAAVEVQDACYAAVDLFHYLSPQIGIALTGGNIVLSQGGPNGGLPRITIGVRANVVVANLPSVQTPSVTGPALRTTANPYPTTEQYLGLPEADISIGLFRGFSVGSFSIGGVDALGSATYVPTVAFDESGSLFSVRAESPIKIGYGGRIGLIEETVWIPGLGVSVMFRDVPKTSMVASIGGDSLQVTDYTLKTMSWRVTTSKSFAGLVLAAGLGQDQYDAATAIESIVNRPVIGRVTTGIISGAQKITRTNYFGNLALNLLVAKLVAEAGIVSGGEFLTSNVFDVNADASRLYGSVGLRIGY